MWPYPWTHVGTPSHLGHMDRVAATMPSEAHAGAAQEAPDIGQWEGQHVPLVRPFSCFVKGGIPSSRRYLPTYLLCPTFLTCTISPKRVHMKCLMLTWRLESVQFLHKNHLFHSFVIESLCLYLLCLSATLLCYTGFQTIH